MCVPPHKKILYATLMSVRMCLSPPEDAYRIDAEVDGEVVGLDILDTAGQVRLSPLQTLVQCFLLHTSNNEKGKSERVLE